MLQASEGKFLIAKAKANLISILYHIIILLSVFAQIGALFLQIT